METPLTKAQWRAEMKRRKAALTTEEKAAEATGVWQRVEQLPCFVTARHILLYHALPDEVDTREALERWAAQGKTLYLPVVVGDDLVLRRYDHETMQQGAFGIWEPVGENVDEAQIELIIVPGVAFDSKGNRLGRGKGYYDRLLSRSTAVRVGVCYSCQLLPSLPAEPHDCLMHYVVTAGV